MKIALLLAAVCSLAACKSKLDKCNHVCDELQAESLAKCSDDACRREAKEAKGACNDLCWTVAGGNSAAKPKLASTEEACHAGTAAACEDLAGMYLLGRGVPKDDAKAAQYFQAACNGGVAFSCEMIGKMYRDGRGVAKDEARGYQLLTKACDDGSAGACTSVGLDVMKRDQAAGVRLLTKACDGKDKLGCMGLGGLYLHGNGVRKDVKRAKEILQKACALGAQPACDKVRTL
ncbi:MAG TPA: tetratricopeptide repeat protein [Polyangia bacterium]|nr:tetratricopeptide repeat protein [Polyangia bacterium]